MPTKDNNIIKYNHGEKSMEVPFIIYADLECLLEQMSICINNPSESSTTKINKHTPSGYSIFTSCSFDESKNKLNHYRGKDCMKKFCKDLKEHATRIINHEKKRIIPLTKEEKINCNDQKVCYICKKEFDKNNTTKSSSLERKKHYKVRDHCHYTGKYRGAAHNICNLRYKVPKEIPVVFHNGSTYDYHFIIKELGNEFEGNFDCLGENTEKYITFSVPLKKKIENKNLEITYKIKLLIVSDLCHHHYLNLLTIYLKEFITINVLIVNLILIILKLKMKNYFKNVIIVSNVIKRNLIKN